MPSINNLRRVKSPYTKIPSATVTETDPRVISEMNSKSRKDAEIQRANYAAGLQSAEKRWAGAPGIDASILPKERGKTLTKKL